MNRHKRDRKVQLFTPHLERYVFSMQYCSKREVMDAGSKDGFGAHLISSVARELSLVDVSPVDLDRAQFFYKWMCNTEFTVCDFEKGYPDKKWDTVVAFEIIEHLEDPDFFIKNVSEHLKEGGTLVFSVPHMRVEKDHKVLFDESSIKALISKYMDITEFYTQDSYGISKVPFGKYPITYVGVAKAR